MNKKFLRLAEVLCVILLITFIAYVSYTDKISTVPLEDVAAAVTSASDIRELKKRDKLEFRDKFSLDVSDYTDFVCYSSETVMDVRELVIVFSDNRQSLEKTKNSIEAYVESKQELFEGYAPEESKMISSHLLIQKKGYTLFYIGKDKEKVLSAFTEKL